MSSYFESVFIFRRTAEIILSLNNLPFFYCPFMQMKLTKHLPLFVFAGSIYSECSVLPIQLMDLMQLLILFASLLDLCNSPSNNLVM